MMQVSIELHITKAEKNDGILFLNRLHKFLEEQPKEVMYIVKATSQSLFSFRITNIPSIHCPAFKLTNLDKHLLITFRALTAIDNNEAFSSDDFRFFGLDRYLLDRQHGIGSFFAKLVKNGYVEEVGRKRNIIRSNHFRKISVYKWTQKVNQVKMPKVKTNV